MSGYTSLTKWVGSLEYILEVLLFKRGQRLDIVSSLKQIKK
jgi:hypothetical protein